MSQKKNIKKVLILGDSGIGKTSLLNRASVGADFLRKDIVVDEKFITLQIWDTAGQDRFQTLGGAFYRGSDCCVLVYDITDNRSFNNLNEWRNQFLNYGNPQDPENFPFVVIGNKSDKSDQRQVQKEEVEHWCKTVGKNNIPHFECSAKQNSNVEQAFYEIAKQSILLEQEEMLFFKPETIKLKSTQNTQAKRNQRSTCC